MKSPIDAEETELALLVRRVRGGSAGAFEELVRRVHSRLRRWAQRFTGDADEAEDVAQLVLLRLHSHVRTFEGRSRLTSWLYRVTHNIALDRRRLETRRGALLQMEQTKTVEDARDDSTATDTDKLERLVRSYFADLPARQRQVFELVDLRGNDASEAAAQLGIKPSTVRVLLLNARRTIRLRMLAEHPRLLEDFTQ
ncbi:MAG: RNA polymerase sigma factor [Gemmatimonadaceae bacterium]